MNASMSRKVGSPTANWNCDRLMSLSAIITAQLMARLTRSFGTMSLCLFVFLISKDQQDVICPGERHQTQFNIICH